MHPIDLWRRLLAEFAGTALLVTAVVGSGIMAGTLSPNDVGLQLLENSVATAFALGALILTFGPVSGAHFNPVVSAADWFLGRRARTGLPATDLAAYVVAQVAGAVGGAILANLTFDLPAVTWSHKDRSAWHLWLGEVVATLGLVVLIFALARSGRAPAAPRPRPPRSPPTSAPPTGSPAAPASPTQPSPSAAPSPTRSPASPPPRCPASPPPRQSAWSWASHCCSRCTQTSQQPPTR